MSLTKSRGNMYTFVTHTHSHLGGKCPHECSYCYAQDIERRWHTGRYAGPVRLIEKEFDVNYGKGKTIFIEHMNDLFAEGVPDEWIKRVVDHVRSWPDNTYVWQTKNPSRYLTTGRIIPYNGILGTTIETNRDILGCHAPQPRERMRAMVELGEYIRTFVTIEPVMDFDVDVLAGWIAAIRPEFVNLGADSKNHHLPEPTVEKIMALVAKLKEYGIDLREKANLQRLKP